MNAIVHVLGVPVLPLLYVVMVSVAHLDTLDKLVVLLLTLLSIGLLFPSTRDWVGRFLEHVPEAPGKKRGTLRRRRPLA